MKLNINRFLFDCGKPFRDEAWFFCSVRSIKPSRKLYTIHFLQFTDEHSFTPTSMLFSPQAEQKSPYYSTNDETISFYPTAFGAWKYV